MAKRDWLAAADRVAHLMDGIQREMVEVKFGTAWDLGSSVYIAVDFPDGNDDGRDRGRLTYALKTRSWELQIDCKLAAGGGEVSTTDVPQWLIDRVPDATKATIMSKLIGGEEATKSDDIPF